MLNSPAAQIVAEATNSKSIQIFHDHLFLKDPGTNKETPWHQDMPYYCVDGNDTGSFWIPLDEVNKENNLKLILRSHKWQKLLRPTKWSNDQPWYEDDSSFMNLPKKEKFIKLSRDVHFLNDDRAKIKLEMNNYTGSAIREIKEYTSY